MDAATHDLPSDRYLVTGLLGEGGMATVWRAWHLARGCWCAIKVLHERYANAERARARFLEEGQTLIRVHHRNVIQAWEAVDAQRPFIVMEVADAGALHDWVRKHGSMPPRMAVDVAVQVCKGVGAAHRAGVIHRDVKPHNVLVNRRGACKVSDFGIARLHKAGEAPDATTHHETMGTLGYMAPEQRSDPRNADARVDVYGIGATLYTLLTGRVVTNLFKAIEDDPDTLKDIPGALIPVLSKATAYRPEARYDTVHDLAKALHAVWTSLPEDARKVPTLGVDAEPEPPPPPGVEVRPATSSLPPTSLSDELGPLPPNLDDFPKPSGGTPVPTAPPKSDPPVRRMATTAPPPELRYYTQPDDTLDEPPPRTRPWFVGLAVLGIVVALPSLPAIWVRMAAAEAERAHRTFTRTVLEELQVVDELGQLGADRAGLETLVTAYRQAPDLPGAVTAAEQYLVALERAEATHAEGRENDRTAALAEARIGRIRAARDGWVVEIGEWRDRAEGFPGVVAVTLRLARAPLGP